MRLTELKPRWTTFSANASIDVKTGITFLCPHCMSTRVGVTFRNPIPADAFSRHGVEWPFPNTGKVWNRTGDTFDTLTLSPSIDCGACGHWHGFVKNGEVA